MSEQAPESTLPYPPIHKDKKFVALSDWFVSSWLAFGYSILTRLYRDGTITTYDSNDCQFVWIDDTKISC